MLIRLLLILIPGFAAAIGNAQCFLAPTEVCVGDCGPLFYLGDDPPGTTYDWSISCGTITNDTLANPHTVCFDTAGTCIIQVIINIPGEDPDTCVQEVSVLPHSEFEISAIICEDDSIEINGSYYTPGIYSDTIFGGAVNGCDSILLITVTFTPPDTVGENYTGCEGDGYSVVINGTLYDESNPVGTEIITGSDGCDSLIVQIELVYNPAVTGQENYVGCQGDSFTVVVNNVIYNESNPSGVETLTALNGCDSIVTINLIYFPHHFDTISYSGCSGDGFSIMVGDTIYNEENPTGTDTVYGGCDTIIIIDLHFDTLLASLALSGNQLCATPGGLSYTWYTCDSIPLADTTECITVSGTGCICVVVDNGSCIDTICQEYQVCDLFCGIEGPGSACLGDSVLFTLSGNAGQEAVINWTITLDTNTVLTYNDRDSLLLALNRSGCFPVEVSVEDDGCVTNCLDTICIVEKSLADLCCSQITCDTCADLIVYLFGTSPWTIAISDGSTVDTISGITNSVYHYLACPPFDTSILYTLLWIMDGNGVCEGGIITDTASLYIEERPDAAIEIRGDTLCALQDGVEYEWTDCDNGTHLSSDACYVPSVSGCYCLTVQTLLTDCVDTSCVDIIISGDHFPGHDHNIKMWFDHAEHSIVVRGIDLSGDDITVQLSDIQGRLFSYESIHTDTEQSRIYLDKNMPGGLVLTIYSGKFVTSMMIFTN